MTYPPMFDFGIVSVRRINGVAAAFVGLRPLIVEEDHGGLVGYRECLPTRHPLLDPTMASTQSIESQ